jgi:hypothetical protein
MIFGNAKNSYKSDKGTLQYPENYRRTNIQKSIGKERSNDKMNI